MSTTTSHPPLSPAEVGAGPGRPGPSLAALASLAGFASVAVVTLDVVLGALSPVRAAVVGPLVVLVPGWLVLELLTGRTGAGRSPAGGSGAERLLWAGGLGLAVLIAEALAVNALRGRTLTTGRFLALFDIVTFVLACAAGERARAGGEAPRRALEGVGHALAARWQAVRRAPLLAGPLLTGGAAVAFAVVGARHLNGGGGPGPALVAVALTALTLALLAHLAAPSRTSPSARRGPTPDGVLVAGLYLAGLATLVMVSLRGASVVGHDIQTEHRVLLDTLRAGRWSPGGFFDAYNSCLSLTLLPAAFVRLLGVSADTVFRVVYPLLFAASGPLVYRLARGMVDRRGAVLAAALFVAFPTFVNDMTMIARQEIATLFFLLAVLAVVDRTGRRADRQVLLLVAGTGTIVTHYSSTYVALGLFAVAVAAGAAVSSHGWRLRRPFVEASPGGALTLTTAALLVVAALGWGLATGTLDGPGTVLSDAVHAVTGSDHATPPPPAAADVRAPGRGSAHLLRSYLGQKRHDDRALPAPAATPASCPITVSAQERTPLTPIGRAARSAGLSPHTLNLGLRLAAAAVFEIGALAGVALALRRQRRGAGPPFELVVLAAGALVALAAIVVLPAASDSYGGLRLYQQALGILAPFIVVALAAAARPLGPRGGRLAMTAVVVGAFLVTSGFVARAVGGYGAQLNLANAGDYHAAYYVDGDDLAALRWLDAHAPAGAWVATDSRGFRDLLSFTTRVPTEALAPGLVPAPAYVLATEHGGLVTAVANHDDAILTYSFPSGCLGGSREVLFRQGDQVVIGPAAR